MRIQTKLVHLNETDLTLPMLPRAGPRRPRQTQLRGLAGRRHFRRLGRDGLPLDSSRRLSTTSRHSRLELPVSRKPLQGLDPQQHPRRKRRLPRQSRLLVAVVAPQIDAALLFQDESEERIDDAILSRRERRRTEPRFGEKNGHVLAR